MQQKKRKAVRPGGRPSDGEQRLPGQAPQARQPRQRGAVGGGHGQGQAGGEERVGQGEECRLHLPQRDRRSELLPVK